MTLTKVTSIVSEKDLIVNTINNSEISVIAKPNAIPKAGPGGVLDASWGVSGGTGTGSGDMARSTYDANNNGIVDRAETADKITSVSTANMIWGTNATNVQTWIDPKTALLSKSIYDPSNSGKVVASISADKLSGNPGNNKLWGTDEIGVQKWLDTKNGDMAKAVYDTNSNGRVDYADIAYELVGATANKVWGTTSTGTQQWLPININDLMLKSAYNAGSSSVGKVDYAISADKLTSETNAPNNSVYGKNGMGQIGWVSLSSVTDGAMTANEYGYFENSILQPGVVALANTATNITGYNSAANTTLYGKNSTGYIGFNPLSAYPDIMSSSKFVDSGIKVKEAKVSDTLKIIDAAKINSALPISILGVVNNEFCNFTNIEQFITYNTCIKASWCGIVLTATGNNGIATFVPEYVNSKSSISNFNYAEDGITQDIKPVNAFSQYLNSIDENLTTYLTMTRDVDVKITFYDVTNSATAQLKLNDTINKSPKTNYFTSVPLQLKANDKLSLVVTGSAAFTVYIEIA